MFSVFIHSILPSIQHWLLFLLSLCCTIIIIYAILAYNRFIKLSKQIDLAYSNLEISMKQRCDELNQLIQVCQEHYYYEQKILTMLTQLRHTSQQALSTLSLQSTLIHQPKLNNFLQQLSCIAEDNPNLEVSTQIIYLNKTISFLETQIAQRGVFFNACVTTYNIHIRNIPENLFAWLFNYTTRQLLSIIKEKNNTDYRLLMPNAHS